MNERKEEKISTILYQKEGGNLVEFFHVTSVMPTFFVPFITISENKPSHSPYSATCILQCGKKNFHNFAKFFHCYPFFWFIFQRSEIISSLWYKNLFYARR